MKKILKIAAIIVAISLLGMALFIVISLAGNPISKFIVTGNAKKYIGETYSGRDYYIDYVGYNFKNSDYGVFVKSHSSEDTFFTISYNQRGDLVSDDYKDYVESGFNTYIRINDEYKLAAESVLKQLPFEMEIAFGEIESAEKGDGEIAGLDIKTLELDKEYDIYRLGKDYGKIMLYLYDENLTAERAAEIFMEVKKRFIENKVSFCIIDLVIRKHENKEIKEWQDKEAINIYSFLYSDIYEEGMLDRVKAAIEDTKAYIKLRDGEK